MVTRMLFVVTIAAGVAWSARTPLTAQAAAVPAAPPAVEIAPDTFLLAGAMLPERGPDCNTVVLIGPAGLVVVDTGRHVWHSDGILAFATARRRPIVALVNTHWHLDHASGNRRVKAAFPAAQVHTTTAVQQAIGPGGFLTRNLDAAQRASTADLTPVRREERDLFIATMDAADSLRPDRPVDRSGPLTLAGRPLVAHVTTNAVTAADLWLYDDATGVAVLGDLVTLPAPFFESACPAQWDAALAEVWATPFRLAVPGHGAPMTRAQFAVYRQAFSAFRMCVAGDTAAPACASSWTRDVGQFLTADADRQQATEYAAYYVDFLRKNGGASPDCAAK